MPAPPRPALPAPRNATELLALGVTIFPGTEINLEKANSQVEEMTFHRIYSLKMYSPGTVEQVSLHYANSLRNSKVHGSLDERQVTGNTEDGNSVDVRMSPAADPKKTMVLMWISQSKSDY
ncbi:MAG: hypothetical protein KIT11_01675 [Fimbriimonadaceae bacterium]|nr:hypothetical protein [Fimbriimonadaceae bacterium]QYK54920.1 MAG: hypothetical protein KF733_07860 [Fimbriimonadaceae bacterium]